MYTDILRRPDYARVITDDSSALMLPRADGFEYKDVKLELHNGSALTVSANDSALCFIALRYNGAWPSGARFLGDTLERSYGTLAWRGLEPDNIMCWYFLVNCGAHTEGFGVKVRPDALCYWTCDAEGVTLWLDLRNGGSGVKLNNRRITAAELVCAETDSESAFRLQQHLAEKMCDHPLLPAKPVYGGNNWCYAYGDSSAAQILTDAAIIREAAQGLENRPFMVIDDGWQELARLNTSGAQGRPYDRGNILFPDMPGLAAEIKAMDVRPGLWMRPLRTGEKFINKALLLERQPGFLDPSLPQTLELIAEDITRLTGWGYELIKYDFVQRDIMGDFFNNNKLLRAGGWSFRNRCLTNAEILKNVSRVICENAGGAELIGCNVIGHLAAGYISMHRSGDDTSGRDYSRSVKMGINCLAFRLAQNDRFFKIDPDCVCFTPYVPLDRTFDIMKLYSMSGAPLFVSVQPSLLKTQESILPALKAAFRSASAQKNDAEPLDWFDTALPEKYRVDSEIYSFKWACPSGWDTLYMS